MDVAREDLLLVFILAAFIAPFAYSYLTGPETTASKETLRFCKDTAAAIETNSSIARVGGECECVPPGTFNDRAFRTAEEVENLTELFLVKCDIPDREKPFIFPVRRIKNNTLVNQTIDGRNLSSNGTTVLR